MRTLTLGELLARMARVAAGAPRRMVVEDVAVAAVAMVAVVVVWVASDPPVWLCLLAGAALMHAWTAVYALVRDALDDARDEFGEAA
ncbi:hypothetical protein ACIRPH_31695 [Nocardiopsis sp. NPDC101807]|uniref:hypothetical protein n=1 Tax=Nocardiopsis sp. NPDC101807 TaxID=3364339 RepID=UPI00381FD299